MAKNVTALKSENPSVATVTEPKPFLSGFDYTQVDSTKAESLRKAADLIRSEKNRWGRAVIIIGQTLLGVKAQLEHGHFGPWLKAEFKMSERTAENYMSVAKEFGSKSETVADLPLKLLYSLAAPSTPSRIRQKVTADLETGKSIDARAVTKEIAVSSKKVPSDKLRRAEKAAHKAALILVKLPPDERQQLLRLLAVSGIRSFLDDAILKCEASQRSGNCEDSYEEPTYCRSIHEMGGPGRGLPKSIHEVPESKVSK
jgi:hypothetical protein